MNYKKYIQYVIINYLLGAKVKWWLQTSQYLVDNSTYHCNTHTHNTTSVTHCFPLCFSHCSKL